MSFFFVPLSPLPYFFLSLVIGGVAFWQTSGSNERPFISRRIYAGLQM